MPLHRQTVPTYFGGLPSTHDFINDPVTNGDAGPASPVDSGKQGTTGSYFVVLSEPATSANSNRPAFALSENTDFIDDLLFTSRPIPAFEAFTAGAADTQQALTGDVFVGRAGVAPITLELRSSLIQVVSAITLKPVVNAVTGVAIFVNDIRDSGDSGNVIGTEVSGYHTGPIAVFSSALPNGINYRLLHLNRGTVAEESDPADATGDMGYMAQLIIAAARHQEASVTPFQPGNSNWSDSSSLGAFNAQSAIDEILDTLASQAAGNGAGKIGINAYVGTSITLSVGSIEDQLEEIADGMAGLAASNTFTGTTNTFSSTTLNLQGTTTTVGAGAAVNLDGNCKINGTFFANADGDEDVGVSNDADSYRNRFGRVHASWSHYREDFLLGAVTTAFPDWIFSAGADVGNDDIDGQVVFTTGGTTGNNEIIEGEGAHFLSGRRQVFEVIIQLDSSITDVIIAVGLTSQIGGNPDGGGDGCWVRFDTDLGDTEWVLVGSDGGGLTTRDSGVAPDAGTFVRITIEIDASGGAEIYVNGVSGGTIAAGSVGTSLNMRPVFYLETRSNNVRDARLDKFEIWQSPIV